MENIILALFQEDRKKAFQQWDEMANKWGTVAEDIIAPCIKNIAEKYFHLKKG
ncbi:MAG: hypothetical protein U0586_10490 [Candidatus Brocadiaceae bacterium]